MKTDDHVRYGNGKKVHLLNKSKTSGFAGLQCDSGLFGIALKGWPLFPTTDPVTCKKCLKKMEGK